MGFLRLVPPSTPNLPFVSVPLTGQHSYSTGCIASATCASSGCLTWCAAWIQSTHSLDWVTQAVAGLSASEKEPSRTRHRWTLRVSRCTHVVQLRGRAQATRATALRAISWWRLVEGLEPVPCRKEDGTRGGCSDGYVCVALSGAGGRLASVRRACLRISERLIVLPPAVPPCRHCARHASAAIASVVRGLPCCRRASTGQHRRPESIAVSTHLPFRRPRLSCQAASSVSRTHSPLVPSSSILHCPLAGLPLSHLALVWCCVAIPRACRCGADGIHRPHLCDCFRVTLCGVLGQGP